MKKIVYLLLLFSISLQAQFYQIGGNNISFSTSFAEIEIETVSGNDYSITFEDGTTATGQSGTVLRHPYSSSLNFLEITSITGDIKSVSILENIHIRLDVLTNLTNLEVITDDFAVSGILEGNLSDLPANVLTFYKRESQGVITGDIQHLAGADYIYIYGNQITVTGDIQHLAGADYIYIYGNQITVTGDIQNLAGVDTIRFIGDQIAVSGDIQHLAGANYVLFIGDQISLSYTSTSWSNAPSNRIQIQELQSGLTQNEVDNLLIDISNAASIPSSGSRIITITANNSAPSAASNSAITFLQNNGYTVNTN